MPEKYIGVRLRELTKQHLTKADTARALLDDGYTMSEIANAVPMSYSQVHSIHKKILNEGLPPVSGIKIGKPQPRTIAWNVEPAWGDVKAGRKAKTKPALSPLLKPKARPGIGKLRTPGSPTDIATGPCANCGFDTAVKGTPTGFVLAHINISAEEYLATIQFCKAVPKVLVK